MPSVTSCSKERRPCAWFNITLFRKNWSRFWPLWSLYGVIWFLILTVGILNSRGIYDALPDNYYPTGYVVYAIPMGILLSLGFGVLCAMAVFSYLYSSRPVGLMHALPIRREGLFLTNYLSGLSFFVLPILVVALLTLGAELYAGHGVDLTSLFLWGWCQCMVSLFFYSFAVFCAMFTGHILALPAFYGILNGLVFGLDALFRELARIFLFGFYTSYQLNPWVEWLTPTLCYIDRMGSTGSPNYHFTGLLPVFVYMLAGLVFTGLALLLYRRRHLETAGDVVAVSWLRPIFKYGVAFCSAVVIGTFLWSVFLPQVSHSILWSLLFFLLLTGALGYFIAEMLLCKSFRVFRQGWKGCLCFLILLTLGVSTLEVDPIGFEVRVPQAQQVVEVRLDTPSFAPYDGASSPSVLRREEDIARLVELHQTIIDHQSQLESAERVSSHSYVSQQVGDYMVDVETSGSFYFSFTYLFRDGGTMRRSYRIPVDEELLADPTSPAAKLDALINAPGLAQQEYLSLYRSGDVLTSVNLSTYTGADQIFSSGADTQLLLDAVLTDLEEGNLGRHYLLENQDRYANCYYNDLTFHFYSPEARSELVEDGHIYQFTITIQTTATHTLEALRELGAEDVLILRSAAP